MSLLAWGLGLAALALCGVVTLVVLEASAAYRREHEEWK